MGSSTAALRPLLVTDLDGTLLAPDGRMSERTADVVAGLLAQGLQFTFATARSPQTALPLLRDLPFTLPAVVYNGAFLTDPRTGELTDGVLLEPGVTEVVMRQAAQFRLTPIIFHVEHGHDRVSAVEHDQNPEAAQYFRERTDDPRVALVAEASDLFGADAFVATVMGTAEQITGLIPLITENLHAECTFNAQPDTYHPEQVWLEITGVGATKAAGIARLADTVPHEHLICFGDNHNDLSMFASADESLAVANAAPAVLAAASAVIRGNSADGVAMWLLENRSRLGLLD
ncbi:HAD-IIB family hydrolase [Kineosporia babensis]|uniref:HAD-IIB family hydrolase n=1 Tax=Kineosporia babensis TaxID=499548 RepID=A0A9X1SZC2_9ACTN|nr:HAD-IIB family hydrolase [Kineosporia babensis]MCD5311863.1 HAD-IIB family hydrolase [Kineosporia babensis]